MHARDLYIEYINRTYKPVKLLTASIDIFSLSSVLVFSQKEVIDLAAPESKRGLSVADVLGKNEGVSLIVLKLTDKDGNVVSRNTYWFSNENDFTSLKTIPVATLSVEVSEGSISVNERKWTVRLMNKSDRIAFFINPQLISGEEEVAPSFWSSNYLTLAPGESTSVYVKCPPEVLKKGDIKLKVEGWNVTETLLTLGKN